MPNFDELIQEAAEAKASDLHLLPDKSPYVRSANGEISPLPHDPIKSSDLLALLMAAIPTPDWLKAMLDHGDVDLSYHTGKVRTRINLFYTRGNVGAAIRLFRDKIPTMQSLGLPMAVQGLCKRHHGLVLFSAPTGGGKSTSIASMLEAVNATQKKRIITIEDPVEYMFDQKQSLISQREIGKDCKSFAYGLRSALREDPDIIMIGEMRDKETIQSAVAAAESGHLVFSTLHSADVIEAVDRILQYFPQGEQDTMRMQFANAFLAVVAQKLLPMRGNVGRVAAFEVLLSTEATRNLVRTGKAYSLKSYMFPKEGMITMEQSMDELRRKGVIA